MESFLTYYEEIKIEPILIQIFESIEYLHLRNISHGDLNINNILIDSETHQIKIIDFGLAKVIQNPDEVSSAQGNYNFRPPKNLTFTSAFINDVWSLALIALSLIKGKVINTCKAIKIIKKEDQNLKVSKIAMFLKRLFGEDGKKCDLHSLKEIFFA